MVLYRWAASRSILRFKGLVLVTWPHPKIHSDFLPSSVFPLFLISGRRFLTLTDLVLVFDSQHSRVPEIAWQKSDDAM